ncbi:MAG: UPF0149 family protein [Comamonas sp.]
MTDPQAHPGDSADVQDPIDELEDLLDIARQQLPELPQWEFCDGFLTALVCTRRPIPSEEYFPLLFGLGEAEADWARVFSDAQRARFEALWAERWQTVATALDDLEVEQLDDDRAFQPLAVDMRSLLAQSQAEGEPAVLDGDDPIPSFGQVWALGFMSVVSIWADEWEPPRKDAETAGLIEDALAIVNELTENDDGPYTISGLGEDMPPGISEDRLDLFGEAIWACYDLRALWKSVGPRVLTVRKAPEPGRNDPCPCGSGKKYKQCHGR